MDQVDNYENKENDTKIFYSIEEIIIVKRAKKCQILSCIQKMQLSNLTNRNNQWLRLVEKVILQLS